MTRKHESTQQNENSPSYLCTECGEICTSAAILSHHLLRVHGQGKLFACEDCDYKSPRKKDLQGTYLCHQNIKPPLKMPYL